MTSSRNVLTPEALAMMDVIARTGSFAAAARELGKVPSALTYNVRQLEDALDVLLFDRRSRQAKLTAAGEELLNEGRRLLEQMDAVANRVKRVATGWETQLTIAVDGALSDVTVFELCEAFFAAQGEPPAAAGEPIDEAELLRHRAVAVADSAQRLTPVTVNLLPGQDVFTVANTRAKLEAQLRCLGCGYLP